MTILEIRRNPAIRHRTGRLDGETGEAAGPDKGTGPMGNRIRIVLADDHPLYRDGVSTSLSSEPGFEVVGECATADEAVSVVSNLLPDVVLLDIAMPGGGIDAAERISTACPVVKILMLTASEDENDVYAALETGASGYILKGIGGDELIAIVRAVYDGESYVSPNLAARLLIDLRKGGRGGSRQGDPFAELTAREEQILKSVAQGLSNKEIALKLTLSEKTIKHYMTNILKKLQVRNRVEAAIKARGRYRAGT